MPDAWITRGVVLAAALIALYCAVSTRALVEAGIDPGALKSTLDTCVGALVGILAFTRRTPPDAAP